MNRLSLRFFPCIDKILAPSIAESIKELSIKNSAALTMYSVFVDIMDLNHEHVVNYSAINLLNSEAKLNDSFELFVGFVYSEFDLSWGTSASTINDIRKLYEQLAEPCGLMLEVIKVGYRDVTDDVTRCIGLYSAAEKNFEKVDYFNGWSVVDKTDHEHLLHISSLYDAYGKQFADKMHEAFTLFAIKNKKETTATTLKLLVKLWNTLADMYPSLPQLEKAMKGKKINKTFEGALGVSLANAHRSEHNIKSFLTRTWPDTLTNFNKIFIGTKGWYKQPAFPLIAPPFKLSKGLGKSAVSTGGGLKSKAAKKHLLLDISLSVTDEKALDILHKRIEGHLLHVSTVNRLLMGDVMSIHARNKKLLTEGKVKVVTSDIGVHSSEPVGLNYLSNTISTFHHYKFLRGRGSYVRDLGFYGKSAELTRQLNLPTKSLLFPFMMELVIEHPEITPSWLISWELFDKSGNRVGYTKAGSSYVAVSYKSRKGAEKAQQVITLNERSVEIVENLIAITALARNALKDMGNDDWRYMLITADGVSKMPLRLVNIPSADKKVMSGYYDRLAEVVNHTGGGSILTKEDAMALASCTHLRPARSTKALLIYFETHSVTAMQEALGHEKHDPDLLRSYLPEDILDLFTNRWIRIFQNGIIYEAMKDSDYLFDAMDITPKELGEFLKNHKLEVLSNHIKSGKLASESIEAEPADVAPFSELSLALSVPVLQVLIAIADIVDNTKQGTVVPMVIAEWYDIAKFITQHLELSHSKGARRKMNAASTELLELYSKALSNPLNTDFLMEQLLCA
ncbi:hypothetical protein AB6E16_02560 [Vibrio atlanticus]|uniref:hypothetical protein n=1 Tax=Vibrio atlanticus TaxID=693153 RepID=UPI003551E91E